MQCGLQLVPGESGWKVKPSADFPVATGRLCQKGLNSLEHVVHEERITKPRQRSGSGWIDSTWDSAIKSIAGEIRQIQEQHGRNAIAVYGGGSLTNEVCYLLGKFTRVALRSKYVDYNGRYCMSSAAAAGLRAFGTDRGMTMPLSEIPHAKYIMLAGTNIAECQPTMMPYLLEAKKNGAVVVTIDPRNTMTSKIADIHVRLQPGFDSVFVNGLLHVIAAENLYDEVFIRKRTEGMEAVRQAVKDYTPDRIEQLTGILPEVTRTIARGFAKAKSGSC